ncbi:hypothetical protein [Anaeromassilibacillus senegalensis]|uniref:hypothetical protein n=1 Tax=Anaeromassilibacillus senegalensis TaxID=1673717 RepID=UPI0012B60CC1|nr:hypothetical protein [Anaeromassilibacillus senegalensis]
MKKICCFLLTALILFSLPACGNDSSASQHEPSSAISSMVSPSSTPSSSKSSKVSSEPSSVRDLQDSLWSEDTSTSKASEPDSSRESSSSAAPSSSSKEPIASSSSKAAESKAADVPATKAVSPQAESSKPVEPAKQEEPVAPEKNGAMVWITAKGKKYHSSPSCSNMKNPREVSVSEAEASGRTPCSKCY